MDISKITQGLTQRVREEAWRIYLNRTWNKKPGTAEGDWLEAERRVRPFKPYVELAAYFNYLNRSSRGEQGNPTNDWLAAEAVQSSSPQLMRA